MRDEVATVIEKRNFLLANYVRAQGPLETKCWDWSRATTTLGYGHIRYNDYDYLTHRLFWVLHNGPIPKGLCVLHKCHRPVCCNPDHLKLGTKRENTHDCIASGRLKPGGEVNRGGQVSSRLSESDVANIRGLTRSRPYGLLTDLARLYGVSNSSIEAIAHGRTWPHVEPSPNPVMPPLPGPRFERRF
jgi:hypothetical protein